MPKKVKKMVLADSASKKFVKVAGRDYVLSEINKAIISGLTLKQDRVEVTLDMARAKMSRLEVVAILTKKGCEPIVAAQSRKGIDTYTFGL